VSCTTEDHNREMITLKRWGSREPKHFWPLKIIPALRKSNSDKSKISSNTYITLIQQSPMHPSLTARYFVGTKAKSLYKGVFRNLSSHTHMAGVSRLKTGHYGYLKLECICLRTCNYLLKICTNDKTLMFKYNIH
jgi:hypothetical protein